MSEFRGRGDGRTRLAYDRLEQERSFGNERITRTEQGELLLDGHPIITRDSTKFNGSVSLGAGAREAILIDDQEYGYEHFYHAIYQHVIARLQEIIDGGQDYKSHVLSTVLHVLRETIPNRSVSATDDLLRDLEADSRDDKIVNLGEFIRVGTGVCRHAAALGAYLFERLHNEGWVGGQVGLKRSTVTELGGHAWIEYTNSAGEVFIMDPMTNEVKSLRDIDEMKNRAFYKAIDDRPNF